MKRNVHEILVYLPEVCYEDDTPEDRERAIVEYAKAEIEQYRDEAFRYYRLACEGDEADRYPKSVIFASDDVEKFIKELEEVNRKQWDLIRQLAESVKEGLGTDLEEIIQKFSEETSGQGAMRLAGHDLFTLVEMLLGYYRNESGFCCAGGGEARVYETTLDQIRQDPSDWALVIFEYDY